MVKNNHLVRHFCSKLL